MEFDMTKVVEKITMQVEENQEEFIFETIYPYCENILQMKINKEELKQILLNGKRNLQPSEDCISRQAFLEELTNNMSYGKYGEFMDGSEVSFTDREIKKVLYNLPSVTPQPKIGHWIYTPERRLDDETDEGRIYITDYRCSCSECGGDFGFQKMSDAYCKYCGAKMEAEK